MQHSNVLSNSKHQIDTEQHKKLSVLALTKLLGTLEGAKIANTDSAGDSGDQ